MKFLRGSALVAVALWACMACGSAGGAPASISVGELAGVWGNTSGVRLTLTADHRASAGGLQHTGVDADCGSSLRDGTWTFMVPIKDGLIGSDTATHAKSIGFLSPHESSCSIFGDVHRDGQYDLCLYSDPDGGDCTAGELLRKQS